MMQIRLVKLRERGVEVDSRAIKETFGYRGLLAVFDTTDQGLHRPVKVARLMQGDVIRSELKDVHVVWLNEGRMTLSGYERHKNETGQQVDYAQSWLCILDNSSFDDPMPTRRSGPTR